MPTALRLFGSTPFGSPGGLLTPSPPTPPATEADIRSAIGDALAARSAIAAIVGPRVYFEAIPEGTALPSIAYQAISFGRPGCLDGPDGKAECVIQVSCVARSAPQARRLAEQVRKFDGFTGTLSGIYVSDIVIDAERDGWTQPNDASDRGTTRILVDLKIFYAEPVPAY